MVLTTLLWSSAGVVTRQLAHAQGFEVTFWRSFFTVVSLLLILPLWQGPRVFARMPWRQGAFWLSGWCWAVMFTAFMVALTMTGVARVLVSEGERVAAHQPLVVLEAMKMEHIVAAPHAGVVRRVHVDPGATVARGAALVEIEAD